MNMFKLITSILAGIGGLYGMFYCISYLDRNYYDFWVLPTEFLIVIVYLAFDLLLLGWNLKG